MFRVTLDQGLEVRRVGEDFLQEGEIEFIDGLPAVDLVLELQCARQALRFEALDQYGKQSGVLLRVAHGHLLNTVNWLDYSLKSITRRR